MFQGVEGGLTRGGPVPGQVFLCEVDQGVGNIRVIRDKSLVKVGEAKERVNILGFSGGWPACDTVKLDKGVHG